MRFFDCTGEQPTTPMQALLIAEAHIRASGHPHLSPLKYVRDCQCVEANTVSKLSFHNILPGLRLRAGASEIEIVRIRPTDNEITYKRKDGKTFRISASEFVKKANQQGYRKVWDIAAFLHALRDFLKPILAAVPLMWVMRLVLNAVRRQPVKFTSTIQTSPHAKEGDAL